MIDFFINENSVFHMTGVVILLMAYATLFRNTEKKSFVPYIVAMILTIASGFVFYDHWLFIWNEYLMMKNLALSLSVSVFSGTILAIFYRSSIGSMLFVNQKLIAVVFSVFIIEELFFRSLAITLAFEFSIILSLVLTILLSGFVKAFYLKNINILYFCIVSGHWTATSLVLLDISTAIIGQMFAWLMVALSYQRKLR